MTWRDQLRNQIKEEKFSYTENEKVYRALESNNRELEDAFITYFDKYGMEILYKGVSLHQVITLKKRIVN